MKNILLISLGLVSVASAQTLECPKEQQGVKLTGYSVFYDKQTELQVGLRKTKGGYEVDMPNKFDYFVCEYGQIKNWQEVRLSPNTSSCIVKVREDKKQVKGIKLVCK